MPDDGNEDCLYRLACECEALLDKLHDVPERIRPDIYIEFQQRFAIWAANLGVFARKSQCLDTRLQNHPDLQDLVARLLDILRGCLQKCIVDGNNRDGDGVDPAGLEETQSTPSQTHSEILTAIDDTLTRLNRLGVRIRQSSERNIHIRAQNFVAGVDLGRFEQLCIYTMQILYPDAHASLKDHLVNSMTDRYKRMLFKNHRKQTLRTRREALPAIPEVPGGRRQADIPVSRPTSAVNHLNAAAATPQARIDLAHSDLSSVDTRHMRSRHRAPDEASTNRYKTSSIQVRQSNYPRLPITEGNNTIYTCPWCANILSRTLSKGEWRRHVDQDFKPYICLSKDCPEAYPTLDDWRRHMRLHSRRWSERYYLNSGWICAVCDVDREVYQSPDVLLSHMEKFHHNDFSNEQLEVISRHSKMDQPRAGNVCLLCCFVVEGQGSRSGVVFPKRRKGDAKQETVKVARKASEMTNPGPRAPDVDFSDTSSDSENAGSPRVIPPWNEDSSMVVTQHIATHLQTLMLLTLRFASMMDDEEAVNDDSKSDSVEIDEGDGSSKHNDVARLSEVASASDASMKNAGENIDSTEVASDTEYPMKGEEPIPDTDLDLSDIPRQYDDLVPENDDFLRRLIESGAYQPSRTLDEVLPSNSSLPIIKTQPVTTSRYIMIPFRRNKHFVGRETILDQLLHILPPEVNADACQRTILKGVEGIGKTEIAVEVAYRILDKYPDCSVFWVPAIDPISFENAYRNIGRVLNFTGIENEEIDIEEVKTALNDADTGRWVLIVDDVDVQLAARLANYIPSSSNGSILFTTRQPQVAAQLQISDRNIISVQKMSAHDSTRLLISGLTLDPVRDGDAVKHLTGNLRNIPLSIRLATAFLKSNPDVTVSRFLELYNSNIASGPALADPIIIPWLISFQHILRQNPEAAEYLKNASLLANTEIPLNLLPPSVTKTGIALTGILETYALVASSVTPYFMHISPLSKRLMLDWLHYKGELRMVIVNMVDRLSSIYPSPHRSNRGRWITYLPHGRAVLNHGITLSETNSYSILAIKVAESYSILRKYGEAEEIYRRTLSIGSGPLGKNSLNRLTSLNGLGFALERQGKYEAAESVFREVLEIHGRLGREGPHKITSMTDLASVLEIRGKWEEAAKLYEQILALQESMLGEEHLDTLVTMNNLGSLLNRQGRYQESEDMHRRTLEKKERLLGRKHLSTLTSMTNLAFVLHSQTKYEEAREIHKRTLQLVQEEEGAGRLDTQASAHPLRGGSLQEDEKWRRLTAAIRERVLGEKDITTFESMGKLAKVIADQIKYEEAEVLDRRMKNISYGY